MSKRQKYLKVLENIGDWVVISEWGSQVAKQYPELLKEAEEQAKNQKNETTGFRELTARLNSYVSEGKEANIEVNDSVSPKVVRYISNKGENPPEGDGSVFLEGEKNMNDMNVEGFYDRYKKAGFHFPTSTLSTYALSLHTKPFVILSGISGTGKTKIAQLFSIPEHGSEKIIDVPKKELFSSNSLYITIRNSWVNGDGRTNLKHETLNTLLTQEELDAIEPKRQELIDQGLTNNYSDLYEITIIAPDGTKLLGEFYLQRPQSPLVRVRFKSKRNATVKYDSTTYFRDHYQDGDVIQFEQVGLREFRIVEKSVEDIETIVDSLEQKELANTERTCFIPVKSDWTDSTELFGHYNLIEQKYHLTKLLKFILEAREYPDHSFFLILDEMNLSKVEHYFSDFLSCIESRRYENGKVIQEKINLHSTNDLLETDDLYFDLIPSSIEIPLNLYVTGTVNIDESTYMFSPKVLDRANVIEFNTVDLLAYGTGEYLKDENYKLASFPSFTKLTLATKADYENLPDIIKGHLVELNRILEKYNLHFGYRTANEVALYIHNATKHIAYTDEVGLHALDYQLIQKVFPKLNGGYAVLEEPLREILLYLSGQTDLQKVEAKNSKFPRTIKKLQRLYDKLSKNGYASFID